MLLCGNETIKEILRAESILSFLALNTQSGMKETVANSLTHSIAQL